jgi:hypothetical protein
MGTQIRRTQDPETPIVLAPATLRSELLAFMGSFDRPTIIFWSTQIFCWLLVVVIAMIWGLGG